MRTLGISPKVIGQAVASVVAWALAHYGINLDPDVSGAIAVLAGFTAGYLLKPGPVVPAVQASSSDDLLSSEAHANISRISP